MNHQTCVPIAKICYLLLSAFILWWLTPSHADRILGVDLDYRSTPTHTPPPRFKNELDLVTSMWAVAGSGRKRPDPLLQ